MIISLVSSKEQEDLFGGRNDGVEQPRVSQQYHKGCWLLTLDHACPPLSSAKNVAADIAVQLCESVANKLEGKVMGTFSSEYLPKPGSA